MGYSVLVCVLVCVLAAARATPGPNATWDDDSQMVDYVPPAFKGFERFEEWKAQAAQRQVGVEIVQCSEVREPRVDETYPAWTLRSIDSLRNDPSVTRLTDVTTGEPQNAYLRGNEIVLKRCSFLALRAAVEFTRPGHSNNSRRDTDPQFDIYIHCGSGRHVIIFQHHLEFGASSDVSKGVFAIKVPDRNVEFNGRNRTRFFVVRRGAHLTVYGLTFKQGMESNYGRNTRNYPSGGYNGGAILVNFAGALTAYKCEFLRNKSYSYYARWGGGGAIKAETRSQVIIWGCYFANNRSNGGGAVGSSSATIIHIAHSTFHKNEARGGVDGEGRLLVHGGAVRVDSIEGHESDLEHVLICNSEFTQNMVNFNAQKNLSRYGMRYPRDMDRIRSEGAAVAAWNRHGQLNLVAGDNHFLTMKGCNMRRNRHRVSPQGEGSRWIGTYVVRVEGAGHIDVRNVSFESNRVRRGVLKIDNSNRYSRGIPYEVLMREISFGDNGSAVNFVFESNHYESTCTFRSVAGIPNGTGDCTEQVEEAEEAGYPVIVD